jgi:phage/conjugal plasmid C-4 type zinc finger TraR family protein
LTGWKIRPRKHILKIVSSLPSSSRGTNDNDSGICEECGEKIPEARLKAVPNANCCVRCQEGLEANPKTNFVAKNPYMP